MTMPCSRPTPRTGRVASRRPGSLEEVRRRTGARPSRRRRAGAAVRLAIAWGTGPVTRSVQRAGRTKARRASRGKDSGRRKGDRGGRPGAYLTGEAPMFFGLRDHNQEEAHCNMIYHDEDSEKAMDQDAGKTPLDDKRKPAKTSVYAGDWLYVEPPCPSERGTEPLAVKPEKVKKERKEEQMIIKVAAEDIEDIRVLSFASARPVGLNDIKVHELQADCDRWGVQTSGTKEELRNRMVKLYEGEAVLKKGCSKTAGHPAVYFDFPGAPRLLPGAAAAAYTAGPVPLPTEKPAKKFDAAPGPDDRPEDWPRDPSGHGGGRPGAGGAV